MSSTVALRPRTYGAAGGAVGYSMGWYLGRKLVSKISPGLKLDEGADIPCTAVALLGMWAGFRVGEWLFQKW